MLKRLIVWMVTLTLVLGVLPASAQDGDEVTIRVLNFSMEQRELYDDLIAEFEEEYPNINVEWELVAQDKYEETMPLRFQSGDAPDFFVWYGSSGPAVVNELLEAGWIKPMPAESATEEEIEEWMSRWEGTPGEFVEGIHMIDGMPYGYTLSDQRFYGHGYMWHHPDLFEQAGIEEPPATWSELLDACDKIVNNTDAYCITIPMKEAGQLHRWWIPFASSTISSVNFDYKTGQYAVDSEPILKTYELLKMLWDNEYVLPGINPKEFSRQAFGEKLAAIYFDGAWVPSVLRDAMGFEDLELGVAPFPLPDEGPQGRVGVGITPPNMFVSSQTEHPEEVWTFIKWLTDREGFYAQEYVGRGYGYLAFTDNAKWLEDPILLDLVEIAPSMRVVSPQPILVCPDLAQSQAQINVGQIRPDWMYESLVEALTTGEDWEPVAAEIAGEFNSVFRETLEAEAEAGLNVSVDCYTFPEWEYDQDWVFEGPMEFEE